MTTAAFGAATLPIDRSGVLAKPWVQFAIVLTWGLALRCATFGDPNIYVDEAFYLLVGQEMHHGAIPYVDIWDRKPLGLFLLYWVFAGTKQAVLAYQVGAWLFASSTALIVVRICARWLPAAAAITGGCIYLAVIGTLVGNGGQGPVFYNLFTATGAWLVLQFRDGGRLAKLYLAMFLLGIAITFKQPALFEAAFWGIVAVWHHRDWRIAIAQICFGCAPFAAIAGWYWLHGYWPQFYNAMVIANSHREPLPSAVILRNATMLGIIITPLLGLVAFSFLTSWRLFPARLMLLWIGAAVTGFLSVPYFVEHYALPVVVPLSIVAAAAVTRRVSGPALAACVVAVAILLSAPYAFAVHQRSRKQFDEMVRAIGPLPADGRLLVFDGPPLLYSAVGVRPVSVLAFPGHINNVLEKSTDPVDPVRELDRLIALRPQAVVMAENPDVPPDLAAYRRLESYAWTRCKQHVRIVSQLPFGQQTSHLFHSVCR